MDQLERSQINMSKAKYHVEKSTKRLFNQSHQGEFQRIIDDDDDVVETSTEYHLPGHNYLGPGTNVYKRLKDRVKPVDEDDYNALQHDVAYASGENPIYADLQAIGRSFTGNQAHQGVLRTGLTLRTIGDVLLKPTNIPNVFSNLANGTKYTPEQIKFMKEESLDPYYIPDRDLKDNF